MKNLVRLLLPLYFSLLTVAAAADTDERERLSLDRGWRFALGHASDTERDFGHGTRDFSYYAKAGYGDGPANPKFDDRAWRVLDVPHDWAVELPFNQRGTKSHGYRAIGYRFPENSIGWYRKIFTIPKSDLGRRVVVEFDGVHRDARVWVNGFYLGDHHSGYTGFHYDVTDYLNYGGDNLLTVRANASMEEGWFYEGAGIYRHVWLTKTAPVHVARYGTFVTTEIKDGKAIIAVSTRILNESRKPAVVEVSQSVIDSAKRMQAQAKPQTLELAAGAAAELSQTLELAEPVLWNLDSPYLYSLNTQVRMSGRAVDTYETAFGIRSVLFDPDRGFFLNGKHVPIKGTNNHQDHAGVGVAVPDALQTWRLQRLKAMGSNAYRAAHNPPTPELLEAADRLGMLMLVENRLMGSAPEQLHELEQMILRDRNHPSVIAWSIGNEEWAIENTETGTRIALTMQDLVQKLDPTRRVTAAMSGGWDKSISSVIDLMGFNYSFHGNADAHHVDFPAQPSWFTEESTTRSTRGIYLDNPQRAHLMPTDRKPDGTDIEKGLQYCATRPFLAGIFFWTGFDHYGEPNPYGWPQIATQSGVIDLCGFPKDPFYYLQSWWTAQPVLQITPHWDWGREMMGRPVTVRVYSNADEVELRLNGNPLGRRAVPALSHAEWEVGYVPGVLTAKAFKNNVETAAATLETTDQPTVLRLLADRETIKSNGTDVAVLTVQVTDYKNRVVPIAEHEIAFRLEGPGKIIGVGNGDPSSHEPDKFLDRVTVLKINGLKSSLVPKKQLDTETGYEFDDSKWKAFEQPAEVNQRITDRFMVVRGSFELAELTADTRVTLFTASISDNQSVYINGKRVAANIKRGAAGQDYVLDHKLLRKGKNIFTAVGAPFLKTHQWEELNIYPGVVQVYRPHATWRRRVFNGLAQVLVQSGTQPGKLVLHAESTGLKPATQTIKTVR
jgi:beta-galactosidase